MKKVVLVLALASASLFAANCVSSYEVCAKACTNSDCVKECEVKLNECKKAQADMPPMPPAPPVALPGAKPPTKQ